MKISYDPEVDAFYIRLIEGRFIYLELVR
ncbi:MAG: DUF2283 domain-containing protein [Syntrophales bacterium]